MKWEMNNLSDYPQMPWCAWAHPPKRTRRERFVDWILRRDPNRTVLFYPSMYKDPRG
jgi:hypothetical protein